VNAIRAKPRSHSRLQRRASMLGRAHDRKPHHFRPLATPLNVLFARFALLSAPCSAPPALPLIRCFSCH